MIPIGRARGRGGRTKKFPVDPEPPLMMPENVVI